MAARRLVHRRNERPRGIAALGLAGLLLLAGIFPVLARPVPVPQPRALVTYSNTASQPILDGAQVTPVSIITVPNSVRGYISDIDVKLRSLEHESPNDLAIMVVGPRGQAVVLMGDAGNSNTIINTYLTFDDDAASQLPNPGSIVSGTYQPSDFLINNAIFTSGAPVPNNPLLSAFDGTDPRGDWRLYILDDALNSADGNLVGGWELIVTTTNTKPHAKNEKYRTPVRTTLNVKKKDGLLKNATDADGKNTIKVESRGKQKDNKGAIKIFRDGSFQFRPKRTFSGKAVYPYTIVDNGGKTDSAKVIIYVDK